MNRNVYALLIVAILASGLSATQAETMEERKQRIMRKYMRERRDIVQGDFGLPEAVEEDARVLESKQFKELGQEFEREEGTKMPRVVKPNQRVPLESERSWWLETAEMEEDPYADLFSWKADTDEEPSEARSPWGQRDDSSAYGSAYGQQQDVQEATYWSGGREDAAGYGRASSRQWDGRGTTYPGSQSGFGMQTEFDNGSPVPGMTYDGYTSRRSSTARDRDQLPGFYGRQPADARASERGWGQDSAARYGSSPTPGLQPSSLPSPSDTRGWNSQSQTPGFTPYRNPYQVQGDEQRRYGDYQQPQPSRYSRPNNYQKWKDSNKTWDPGSDNLYLDELMRNERR